MLIATIAPSMSLSRRETQLHNWQEELSMDKNKNRVRKLTPATPLSVV